MMGRLVLWTIVAWSYGCVLCVEARTTRDNDRTTRNIEDMEHRLQASAAVKRTPLTAKSSVSARVQSPASSPKPAPNFLERLFGKVSQPETPLRPVSGKGMNSSSRRPAGDAPKPGTLREVSGLPAPDRDPGVAMRLPQPAPEIGTAQPTSNGADLKKLVNSLLSHMTPMSGGGSDDAIAQAGSYRFEDYVYEQRKRDAGIDRNPVSEPSRAPSKPDPNRLLGLLSRDEANHGAAELTASPEKKRQSSTALLGSVAVAQPAPEAETAAPAEAGKAGGIPSEGQSSTYKKAVAKLQTYEAPTPPPLRAVSGFQGLMKTKPSAQSVEQERAGVLSALQMR